MAIYLNEWLKSQGQTPVLVDGDVIRNLLVEPMGFDIDSRLKVAKFNARLCQFLASQKQTVICSTISLFKEVQVWNRSNIPGYLEIFLDVSLVDLLNLDSKGIYKAFENNEINNVVGLDISAHFPENPDIALQVSLAPDAYLL